MPVAFNSWQLLGVILASAVCWLHYVQLKDRRRPEPRRRLVMAFGLGVVAWAISVLGFMALDALDVPDIRFNERRWTAVYCFLFIGPLEEGAKVLLAYLFVFRWREFDETLDGFVYAAAISLGFASMENFHHLPDLHWAEQLARTAALPFTHMLFGAIWGFAIAHARFTAMPANRRVLWQAGGIALAMCAHGLYDYLILAFFATYLASGLAFALWLFVVWRARECAREPVRVPADQGRGD